MAKLNALYANALFELAVEGGAVDEFLGHAVFLRGIIQEDECLRVLLHPDIPDAEKYDIFGKALDGHKIGRAHV